jgi:hypothetical protein
MAQIDIGGLPYAKVAEVIELFATEVAPELGDPVPALALACALVPIVACRVILAWVPPGLEEVEE